MRIAVLAVATTVAFAPAAWAQTTPSGTDATGGKGAATQSQDKTQHRATQQKSGAQMGAEQKSSSTTGQSVEQKSRTTTGMTTRSTESSPGVVVHKRVHRRVSANEPSVTIIKKKRLSHPSGASATVTTHARGNAATTTGMGTRSTTGSATHTTGSATHTRSTTGSSKNMPAASGSSSGSSGQQGTGMQNRQNKQAPQGQ